ncbi:MAG: NTP transferase domain-containing protein, partial [Gemmatimonadetes bacterium]|nr:NTP transferase domain-containing protein [Gemmatimonadota bacterium]
MTTHLNAYAAILAGGIGSRFWPASTPARPKQLLPLAGPEPLIDETLDRAIALVGADRVRVVASAPFVELMRGAMTPRGVPALAEPMARGTGPALAWAAHAIERETPGAVMISMHSDHRIVPFDGLRETLAEAIERAAEGYLCCIGVRPDRPETGYGYVELGEPVGEGSYTVQRFVEKPDHETAVRYRKSGAHLWNTGIFIWR